MKKLLVVLAFGLLCMGKSEAAVARGAKAYKSALYSTTVSSVSIPGASVVYEVVMSTGATGDFLALFDTTTVTGVTAAVTSGAFVTRCMAGSTITTTVCTYDPPLQFNNGIAAILSTANDAGTVVYERGRVIQGY